MLLELYVIGQPRAQRVSHRCVGTVGQACRVAPDQHMVEQRPDDGRMIRIGVRGIRRQEHLVLEAEVVPFLGLPVHQESRYRLGHHLRSRPAEPPGDHQGMMMIARQRREGRVAFHARDETATDAPLNRRGSVG